MGFVFGSETLSMINLSQKYFPILSGSHKLRTEFMQELIQF